MGVLRPSAMVPSTMAGGEASGLGSVAIVSVPALREFHPTLCAANLTAAGIDVARDHPAAWRSSAPT